MPPVQDKPSAPINVKLLLIGNSSVGKSSLLLRFSDEQWLPEDESSATIGVDFRVSCAVRLVTRLRPCGKGALVLTRPPLSGTQDGGQGEESQTEHMGASVA